MRRVISCCLAALILFVPIVSSQTQQDDQAILSRITQVVKKIEALEAEQQELRTRQEQAVEKIKSLKIWANRFR